MALQILPGFNCAIADDAASLAAGMVTPSRHNLAATVTGAVSGALVYATSTTSLDCSALLGANTIILGGGAGTAPTTSGAPTWNATAGQGLVMSAGTATTDVAAMSLTRTNNNAAVATGVLWTFTDTSSAAGFLPFQILGGSAGTTNLISVGKAGQVKVPNGTAAQSSYAFSSGGGLFSRDSFVTNISDGGGANIVEVGSSGVGVLTGRVIGWGTSSQNNTLDAAMSRGGANQIIFGAGTSALTTSHALLNKQTTGIADNTATAVCTFTIPNAAHFADFKIRVVGTLGAGGAIGANESTQSAEYNINITRTAGVNAVATISAVIGQAAAASVAGAANAATTAVLSAISGGIGATNTFTVNATIAHSGGSSTNHVALVNVSLLNGNATGITVA